MYLGGVSCSNWSYAQFLQHFTCGIACDRGPVGNTGTCNFIGEPAASTVQLLQYNVMLMAVAYRTREVTSSRYQCHDLYKHDVS